MGGGVGGTVEQHPSEGPREGHTHRTLTRTHIHLHLLWHTLLDGATITQRPYSWELCTDIAVKVSFYAFATLR